MEDFDGQGLFILAAVVIAFVNWVSNSLKEKAAAREQERRRARGDLVEPEPVDEEVWPAPDQTPTGRPEAGDQLRAFFDSLNQGGVTTPPAQEPQQERAAIPPARTAAAVELPPSWRAPDVQRAKLTKEEEHALARVKAAAPTRAARRDRRSTGTASLIAQLRYPAGARDALILTEIFGKPKALADSDPIS